VKVEIGIVCRHNMVVAIWVFVGGILQLLLLSWNGIAQQSWRNLRGGITASMGNEEEASGP